MAKQTLEFDAPESSALTGQTNAVLAIAEGWVVDSPEMLEASVDELKAIKDKAEALDAQRKTITGPMDEAKKRVMDLYRGPLEALNKASTLIRRAVLVYQEAEAAKDRAAQAEAKRLADEERTRLEAQAREKEAQAQAAVAQGNYAEAESLAADAHTAAMSASVTVAPTYTPTYVAPKGVSTRSNWKAELEGFSDEEQQASLQKLIEFVAANPSYINALQVNTQGLNAFAKAQKQALKLPGVRVFNDTNLAVRRAA